MHPHPHLFNYLPTLSLTHSTTSFLPTHPPSRPPTHPRAHHLPACAHRGRHRQGRASGGCGDGRRGTGRHRGRAAAAAAAGGRKAAPRGGAGEGGLRPQGGERCPSPAPHVIRECARGGRCCGGDYLLSPSFVVHNISRAPVYSFRIYHMFTAVPAAKKLSAMRCLDITSCC